MEERSIDFCDGVTLISVNPIAADKPHHWLEFTGGNGVDSGPYRIAIMSPLMTWLTHFDPGKRMTLAFQVLRIHMGEETPDLSTNDQDTDEVKRAKEALAKVPRRNSPRAG